MVHFRYELDMLFMFSRTLLHVRLNNFSGYLVALPYCGRMICKKHRPIVRFRTATGRMINPKSLSIVTEQ